MTRRRNSFLVKLGLPVEWIAAFQATLAKVSTRPPGTVENLVIAGRRVWAEAHDVLVKEIAPDCVSQDYQYIDSLVESILAVPDISDQIPGWAILQGSVYHQFKLEAAVNSDLEAGDDTLAAVPAGKAEAGGIEAV